MTDLRCMKCGKKLGEELRGSLRVICPRCKSPNVFIDLTKSLVKV